MKDFFENTPPPFIKELEKYNRGKNELKISLGDLKFENQETDLYILRIYVDPEKRHRGIANKMLSEVMNLGKEYGFKKIWLEASFSTTFIGNAMPFDDLKKWYNKKGFEICEDLGDRVYMSGEL